MNQWMMWKESGRIRRRFSRNIGIYQRMKNYSRFMRVFDCYSFNSILDYKKIVKILPKCFCFFKIWFWIGQYDPFHTIIIKFYFVFKETWYIWVFSPRIWNVSWMHFSKMNLLHQLTQWRDDPEIPNFFKNKVKFDDYGMKWIVLPYSESYFEETKTFW